MNIHSRSGRKYWSRLLFVYNSVVDSKLEAGAVPDEALTNDALGFEVVTDIHNRAYEAALIHAKAPRDDHLVSAVREAFYTDALVSSLAQFELNPDGTGTPSREAFRAELRSQREPLRDAFIDVAGVTPEEWVEDSAEQPQPARALDAAWYPDPEGEARLRYFDGKDWTEHTA